MFCEVIYDHLHYFMLALLHEIKMSELQDLIRQEVPIFLMLNE